MAAQHARRVVDRRHSLYDEAREAYEALHGGPWSPREVDTRPSAVFGEFGPLRWLVVPLAALAFAAVVFAVGFLAGAAS